MRRVFSINIVFFAALALLLAGPVACSDDAGGGSESQDTGITEDGSINDDQDSGTQDSGPDDEDDSGPDDNDIGSDAGPSDASDTSDGDDGSDADSGDPGEDHEGCTHPAQEDAGCAPEDFGDWGPGSVLSDFNIMQSGECCFDFDNDTQVDSGLGDLIDSLKVFLNVDDFNEEIIQPQIDDGTILFLFEYAYWSDPVEDPALDFNLLFGEHSSTPAFDGSDEFYVSSSSLENGEPKSDFPSASVSNRDLSVPAGTASLLLPVGADFVEAEVEDLRIQAEVLGGTDLYAGGGVSLSAGTLSGYVTLDSIFGSLNDVAANCSCISTTPLFTETSDDVYECGATSADQSACSNDPSEMCRTLSTSSGLPNCSMITSMVSNAADLSIDDDSRNEAITMGVEFEAVGASIVGEAP